MLIEIPTVTHRYMSILNVDTNDIHIDIQEVIAIITDPLTIFHDGTCSHQGAVYSSIYELICDVRGLSYKSLAPVRAWIDDSLISEASMPSL